MVDIGNKAPTFTLPASNGKDFVLENNTGDRGLALLFYPFAHSPVCTTELGFFNGISDELRGKGINIAAISTDSKFVQASWAKSEGFTFPLLSDYDRTVINAYGAVVDPGEGKTPFARRSVFIMDSEGTITYRWLSEAPPNEPDYDEVQAALNKL